MMKTKHKILISDSPTSLPLAIEILERKMTATKHKQPVERFRGSKDRTNKMQSI